MQKMKYSKKQIKESKEIILAIISEISNNFSNNNDVVDKEVP
jgi:hypothetical protein